MPGRPAKASALWARATQTPTQGAQRLLHVAAAVLWLGCLLPQMAQWFMHTDGLTYSAIARQLARQPMAAWWHLHYTQTVHPAFFEHPPLGFWFMALWYRWVMANAWAEMGYALLWSWLLFAALSAGARRFGRLPAGGGWLACLLLMACPLSSWLFANVMLEAPLMAIMALALGCFAWAAERRSAAGAWLGGGGAGLLCAAGCLLKGPTALAAMAVPAVLFGWGVPWSRRRLLQASLAAVVAIFVVFLAIGMHFDAAAYLHAYWQQQVLRSMRGQREYTGSRWNFLYYLATELVVPVVVLGALRHATRRPLQALRHRATMSATLLALLASLPLALSQKQHRWYLAASLPYFANALALAGQPAAQAVEQALATSPRLRRRFVAACGLAALAVTGLTVKTLGRVRRNADIYHAFLLTPNPPRLPPRVAVCPPQLLQNYWLHGFFMRYFEASLTHDAHAQTWLVGEDCPCEPSPLCRSLGAAQTAGLRLLRCPSAAEELVCAPPLGR